MTSSKRNNIFIYIATTIIVTGLLIFPIIFLMPRIVMLGAQYKLTNTDTITSEGKAPLNSISHTHRYPTAKDKVIVRLNTDTFYSSGWFKLNDDPYIIHVPATGERYYSIQFNDAWTNAFAYIGKRATGNQEAFFAVVGPDWTGELPDGIKKISSPTNLIWVIGRTMFYGKEDIEAVKTLQEQITFTSLSKFN